MVTSQADFQLEYVSEHIDQTRLVNNLLHDGFFDYDEVLGWDAEEDGYRSEIFEWKVFPRFLPDDYNRLVEE